MGLNAASEEFLDGFVRYGKIDTLAAHGCRRV